ncbi:MAG TPA: prephenate dehydrogenase/arogenate dehydrogenase family protein, partial [Bacteroidota bacterium]|nr:prephenate dehydrogenase/arogenate dehydrogenase family protein [Bacteroidota bacterium]
MKKIALIGFGRFGKLITKFIYKDFEICVFDNKLTKKKLDVWKKKNINGKSNIELLNEKDISKISIVLLCVPISSIKEVAKKINKYLNDETLIIDFCSVKLYPLKVLKRYLKKSTYILATPPLFGPDSVSDSLNGKKIVL